MITMSGRFEAENDDRIAPFLAERLSALIVGELYKADSETIGALDQIEGYDEKNMRDSLFIRKPVKVKARLFANGRYVKSFCYFFNREEVKNEIPQGDYRRYLLEKQCDKRWILAYGSNMSGIRLVQRIGPPDAHRKGYIEGFRLVFNKKVHNGQAVFANIAFGGDNAKCPAVAYRLTSNQLNLLDQYEGAPVHYLRISLPLILKNWDHLIYHKMMVSFQKLHPQSRHRKRNQKSLRKNFMN